MVHLDSSGSREAEKVTPAWWNASPSQLIKRVAQLEADLELCQEYFADRMDVVDGDYGQPSPNREMQLHAMIDETINGRPY